MFLFFTVLQLLFYFKLVIILMSVFNVLIVLNTFILPYILMFLCEAL